MKTKSIALICLFITYASAFAQDHYAKLDSLMMLLESHQKFMGSVAISKDGKVLYSKSIGVTDTHSKQKTTSNTKYRIGSISKVFTATLIFKAVEEGKLNLDQTLATYFPNIPNAQKITISQLLQHRSGIYNITNSGDYWNYYTQTKKQSEMLAIIAKTKSEFEPGTKADYSNTNYILLSYILEKVYHTSYGELLSKKITKPLGLSNTYLGSTISLSKNECFSFRYNERWIKEKDTDLSIPIGAGAIVSNPIDLTLFIQELFAEKIITKKSLDQMTTIKDNYGMGIFQVPFHKHIGYGHTGGIDGFSSSLGYFPDNNVAVAITSNGNNYEINNLMIALLSAYFSIPFELPVFQTATLTEADLDTYLGNYVSEELAMTLKITRKESVLFAQATGQSEFPLEAIGSHRFQFSMAGIVLKFDLANQQMTLQQAGKTYIFRKL